MIQRRPMRLLTVAVMGVHKRALERLAEQDGETQAVIVRRLIRQEAQERGLWPAEAEQPQEVHA